MSKDAASRLKDLGIERVALFDDQQPDATATPRPIEDDAWDALINGLANNPATPLDPNTAQDLRQLDQDKREDALGPLQTSYPERIAQFRSIPEAVRDAGIWVDWFKKKGASVDVFVSWKEFEEAAQRDGKAVDAALGEYGLVLLDYDFGLADNGEASERIAKGVSEQTRRLAGAGASVPILARFSALPIERTEADVLEFLEGIEFPRSAYAVIPKAAVRAAGWEESFLRELEKTDAGRRLFALTTATKRVLMDAVSKEAERLLFRLDAPSVRLLSERALEPEGVTEVEHWMDIIIHLVAASLRESAEVARATAAMLELMANSTQPGMPFDTPALSEIENRLRFDYAVNELLRPVDFGDIFTFESAPGSVAVVVTQACDMAVRATGRKPDGSPQPGAPERVRVVMVLGKVVEEGLRLGVDDEGCTTDFSSDRDGAKTAAIDWQVTTPVMLPRSVLDLVSLRPDGQAVLPETVTSETSYWTGAFRAYLASIVVNTNAAARDKNKRPKGPIRFDGEDDERKAPGLGLFAQYGVARVKDTSDLRLGLRRIARLSPVETQRIAHRMNFHAGRVALATRLPYQRQDLPVVLVPQDGSARQDLVGEVLSVEDSRTGKKDVVGIHVETARFRELCRLASDFADLDSAAADFGQRVDINGLLATPDLKNRFVLKRQGDQYEIRVKQAPADSASAAASARPEGGRPRRSRPRRRPNRRQGPVGRC
ncbi:MAG TPA: hypothetical protein VGQ89_16095 [Candidatus Limnocylindrales bacterium]|jgi:hypothetical protein|nr:hypothetical protein [Candidatus Limnocylindrales bacterium]